MGAQPFTLHFSLWKNTLLSSQISQAVSNEFQSAGGTFYLLAVYPAWIETLLRHLRTCSFIKNSGDLITESLV
jgi:hypothetical protein